MKYYQSLLLVLCTCSLLSCSERSLSPSGYEYIHDVQTQGNKPIEGDRVLFQVDIIHGTELIQTSRNKPQAASMVMRALEKINSPVEEALHLMAIGDSMRVFVQIDTLYPQYDLAKAQQKELTYHLKVLDIIKKDQKDSKQTASVL